MASMSHMTARRQQNDGTYRTECSCGWTSEPSRYREALGWACGAEDALKKLNAEMAEAEQQIVREVNGERFTLGELRALFDRVADETNWKKPIDAMVRLENERAIFGMREAVIWFTGSVPEIVAVLGEGYRVTAAGYYITIGA